MLKFSLVATLLSSVTFVLAVRQYTIVNECPTSIPLYVNGASQGTIGSGGNITRTYPNSWDGVMYTSANGGNQNAIFGTSRAGFYGPDSYYYIVVDPSYINAGISIAPKRSPRSDFCVTASCDSITCSGAYGDVPTAFPPPSGGAPEVPLYSCPVPNIGYTVTFCPNGDFSESKTVDNEIHPNGNNNECLDVRGAVYANGTPVQIYDCNGTGAQNWTISRGNTKVQVAGTNFCLDAGSSPGNGVGMKVWQCYDGLDAQAWYYTDDDRIALTGKGQCLDLADGSTSNGNRVQTWQCTDGNNNQGWTE